MPQLFSVEPPGTVQLAAGQSLAEREKGPQRGDVAGLLLLGRREPRRARVAKRKAVVTRSAAGFLHAGNSCPAGFTHASGLPEGYPRVTRGLAPPGLAALIGNEDVGRSANRSCDLRMAAKLS